MSITLRTTQNTFKSILSELLKCTNTCKKHKILRDDLIEKNMHHIGIIFINFASFDITVSKLNVSVMEEFFLSTFPPPPTPLSPFPFPPYPLSLSTLVRFVHDMNRGIIP